MMFNFWGGDQSIQLDCVILYLYVNVGLNECMFLGARYGLVWDINTVNDL